MLIVLIAFVFGVCGGDPTEEKKPSLSFLIPIHSQQPSVFLRSCLESLQSTFRLVPSEVILTSINRLDYKKKPVLEKLMTLYPSVSFHLVESNPFDENPKHEESSLLALNRGASLARGDYLIFLSPFISVSEGAIQKLLSVLDEDKTIGVVGPKIHFEDRTLYHAGLVLIQAPAESEASYWRDQEERLTVFYEYSGYDTLYEPANQARTVHGLSKAFMITTTELFRSVGNFTSSYKSPLFFDMDFCLTASHLKSLRAEYVPEAVAIYGDKLEAETQLRGNDDDAKAFHAKWSNLTSSLTYAISDMVVVWNMECGVGGTLGFTTEAVNLVLSIYKLVKVKVEVYSSQTCQQILNDIGFPQHIKQLFHWFMLRSTPQNSGMKVVNVLHFDPGRYSNSLQSSRYFAARATDYVIGRSMFETDRIPTHWLRPCNDPKVNEIWLPTSFNFQTFNTSGVQTNKLRVIPELIDHHHFDPKIHEALWPLDPEVFRFLSILKWEARKAWRMLLSAYFDEFCGSTKVEFFILCRMNEKDQKEYQEFRAHYLKDHPECLLPPVRFIREMVPYQLLPSVYKSANTFVLASHGEGWGLPLTEAMAMGIPTIGTNWSGNIEFMNQNNSLLVSISGLEPSALEETHLWASINATSLRAQLRKAFEGEGKKLAQQGAHDIRTKFNFVAVGQIIKTRLEEISPIIVSQRQTKAQEPPQQTNQNYGHNTYSQNYGSNYGSYSSTAPASQVLRTGSFIDEQGKEMVRIKIN